MKEHFLPYFDISRILRINEDGIEVMSGHNGPYHDEETELRIICHLIILLCNFNIYNDEKKRSLVLDQLVKLLFDQKYRPMNASYYHRKNKLKDLSNGLMGQAWVIECFLELNRYFGNSKYLELAKELYHLHPFDEKKGSWCIVNVDGSISNPDPTFNHQLWFAAMASEIDDEIISSDVEKFFNISAVNVDLYRNGIIYHHSSIGKTQKVPHLPFIIDLFLDQLRTIKNKRSLYLKSVGYHSFNLYAYAILNGKFPDNSFWSSSKYKKMLNVTKSEKFMKDLEVSSYGWEYNPPGIELAYVGQKFNLGTAYSKEWFSKHFYKTFDPSTNELLTSVAHDKNTSCARIYEIYRIENLKELMEDG
jgi:hypothetical protein